MRHAHRESAGPIGLSLLMIPLLMVFGVMKGCDAVKLAIEPDVAPATVRTKTPPAEGPPSFIIEDMSKGWRI
jgi:hypothetical protein